MLLESIRMSWENIINNKLRSFLTMLGIVIGVASIIALITLMQGARQSISDQVSALGVNKIMVTATGTFLKQGLNDDDINKIASLNNISGVSPTISARTNIAYKDRIRRNVPIQGKNEQFFKNDNTLLRDGRVINILDIESKNNVALIGTNVINDLFYGENPIGKEIIINSIAYTIIGTLNTTTAFSINSNNNLVIIPYTTAMKTLGVKNVVNLDVFLTDTNKADQSVNDIKQVLSESFNYKDDSFTVFNMGDMIQSFQIIISMMSMLLAGIAAISLVVGGIGIMNMMLVSITERTTEIGLRKALGATPITIQLQFIIEAIFLSLIGGIIGLLVGSIVAYIASILIDLGFVITPSTIGLAVGFSAAVGIIFGYMPARKASMLNPIDALRSL
ncbi:MAG: ABC transporter permease [Oscillospiraceae bacterium]|nr:ABC transporter permease [Oscillospiraceae bacterium]